MIANYSLINSNVMITEEKWGVTLTVDEWKNHARLIFEGILDNNFFYQIAHLNGNCQIEKGCCLGYSNKAIVNISEPRSRNKFKASFAKKTCTYLASKEKIRSLILEIENERGCEVPFNILGSKSVLSKPTKTFHIYDKTLSEIKIKDTKLFLFLYDSFRSFEKSIEIDSKKIDNATLAINEHLKNDKRSYLELIQMVKTSVVKEKKYQDSCYTWATGKLKKIGAEVNGGWLENIASITRLYIHVLLQTEKNA